MSNDKKILIDILNEIKDAATKKMSEFKKSKRTFWSSWFNDDMKELQDAARNTGYIEGLLKASEIIKDKFEKNETIV